MRQLMAIFQHEKQKKRNSNYDNSNIGDHVKDAVNACGNRCRNFCDITEQHVTYLIKINVILFLQPVKGLGFGYFINKLLDFINVKWNVAEQFADLPSDGWYKQSDNQDDQSDEDNI